FLMTDLDIGMNHRLCNPFEWDDARAYDRGKVMTAEELEAGKQFGRYLDVDGDGIPYRTYPGTHPTKGAYFTRGTTKDEFARYSEEGPVYVRNMERLEKKFDTAKKIVPRAIERKAKAATRMGVIYFGSTSPAMNEAFDQLDEKGIALDGLRVRAYPFGQEVVDFVDSHDTVFFVEQNRDGQLRMLLIDQMNVDPNKIVAVLHYDGTPITARFITKAIGDHLAPPRRMAAE
ncbi:MAG: 2-oxoacid:acceptor oxidoreductase subunit alpha, partial [Reyranellaceae bacterium]